MSRREGCGEVFKLYLISRNAGKVREFQRLGVEECVDVSPAELSKIEIQSDELSAIALYSAVQASLQLSDPFFVEDSGLYIPSLGGFPGPYSSYVYRTLGVRGILKLMEGLTERQARFESVIVLYYPEHGFRLFRGVVEGTISREVRGLGGFGFDPIFIPDGHSKTFAEMPTEAKNSLSHRGKAFRAMVEWLRTTYKSQI
ncbi:MAG: XTP/dITP diphosphatase [Zestosphaera sp.]